MAHPARTSSDPGEIQVKYVMTDEDQVKVKDFESIHNNKGKESVTIKNKHTDTREIYIY